MWLIWGCGAGQGMVFGPFVLNRVYNFMSLLNRVCILPIVLTMDLK